MITHEVVGDNAYFKGNQITFENVNGHRTGIDILSIAEPASLEYQLELSNLDFKLINSIYFGSALTM